MGGAILAHKHDHLFDNDQFLSDLANLNLSTREVAKRWGTGPTFIQKHRQNLADGKTPARKVEASQTPAETTEQSSDGSRSVEAVRDRPVTLDDARDWIKSSGDNPDDFDISIRSIAYGYDMFSNRMSATPKKGRGARAFTEDDYRKASAFIADFTYIPARKDFLTDVAVLQPTDEQWGKTDFLGGSEQTAERILNSYSAFVDYCTEYRPREILLARTGDGIENCGNASNQRDTNDLDVPHQVLAAFKADLAGLKMVAPLAERVVSAHVPSNHGRWRTGLKADAGDPHADYGIANAKMLADVIDTMGVLGNVEIVLPDALMESLSVEVGGTRFGLVHGHQASGPDKMGDWWAKQDHGRMPTWNADALFVGHWHSYRVYESGDGRPVFIGPASDNGSSWFSNIQGVRSTAGMLAVSFSGKRWKYQEIL